MSLLPTLPVVPVVPFLAVHHFVSQVQEGMATRALREYVSDVLARRDEHEL